MVIVILQWSARPVLLRIAPDVAAFAVLGEPIGGLAVIVWWAFFSRAPWSERGGAILLMIVALAATPYILHESIRTGNMGIQFFIYAPPVLSLAFVVWAVVTRKFSKGRRRAAMVATILLACGGWALLRSDGLDGDEPTALPSVPAAREMEAVWPGFRGPDRDGSVSGVRIATDWSASPPVELWRRAVGPAVSSFAVAGDLLYTQEQRGDDEIVAGYSVTTGEPVWRHHDAARRPIAVVASTPSAQPGS